MAESRERQRSLTQCGSESRARQTSSGRRTAQLPTSGAVRKQRSDLGCKSITGMHAIKWSVIPGWHHKPNDIAQGILEVRLFLDPSTEILKGLIIQGGFF